MTENKKRRLQFTLSAASVIGSALAAARKTNAAEPDPPEQLAKFRIEANTGGVMFLDDERIAIDVNGIQTQLDKEIPIIYGHDYSAGIGHSTARYVKDGAYVVEGVVSRGTPYASDFEKSLSLGFPWQASVGGFVLQSFDVAPGEVCDLHGRAIEGPCQIVTAFELDEVSVVEYGADPLTNVKKAKGEKMDVGTQKKEELTAGAVANAPAAIEAKGTQMNIEVQKQEEPTPAPASRASFELNLDPRKSEEDVLKAERERVAEIKARSIPGDDALQVQAIREGWTPDKFELATLRASRPKAPSIHCPAERVDERALEAAALRSAGFTASEKRYTDAELTAADKLGGVGFVEFCERASGSDRYSFARDPYRKIAAALSTSRLGSALSNAANQMLISAYETADTSWRDVFKITSVPDYKKAERWRIDSNFRFEKTPKGAPLTHAEAADEKFEIQAQTWGRQFSLSEEDVVNGDALGVLGELLRQVAFGANEALCAECWGMLMNPGNCSDSKAFYHADHGSLLTSKALTLDNLSAARGAFITRKKGKAGTVNIDEPLGIPPQILLVPSALEDAALALVHSTMVNNGSTANTPANFNPHYNRFKVVAVPYLGYSTFTNYSDTTWYLLADPARLPAFEIAFLHGNQTPIVRSDEMRIGRLGIEFDARLAWGVAVEDYRAALKVTA